MVSNQDIRWIYEIAKEDPVHEAGEILGSMTTPPPSEVVKLITYFINKNAGDPKLFKSIQMITERLVQLTKELLGIDEELDSVVTSGGTESNILAIYAYRQKTKRQLIVAPDTAHFSIDKASNLLSMKRVVVTTNEAGNFAIEDFARELRNKNAVSVLTLGTTELGSVDDVEGVIDFLADTNTPLHIDAALGGFTYPFTHKKKFDKMLSKVINSGIDFSISIDYHKFVGAPIPSGIIFFKKGMLDYIKFRVNYMLTDAQYGLLGTRPGYSAAGALATLLFYGKNRLEDMAKSSLDVALWYRNKILSENLGFVPNVPEVPVVCSQIFGIERDELLDYLASKRIFLYKCDKAKGIRIVAMPHVKKEHLQRVIDELLEYKRK